MSKRKGVSADEKRTRLLQLFYERREFFQLKELEKIAPKEKGIVAQSVKDTLQGLVDDGQVDTDKIGTSIYFWAFPGKALTVKRSRLESILLGVDRTKEKLDGAQLLLAERRALEQDLDERDEAVRELTALRNERDLLQKRLDRYSNCDAKYLQKLTDNNSKAKEAVNRWTENIYTVKGWCGSKMMMDADTINKHFGIPEDLDYVEL